MRRCYIIGALALALFITLTAYLASLTPSILSLQFTFAEPAFQAVLGKWQPVGIALYRSHFPADFVLLALYGTFGFIFGHQFSVSHQLAREGAQVLVWSLPVAALADAGENVLHLLLTDGQSHHAPAFHVISGVASLVKWLAFVAFILAVIVARRMRAG